ncbi:MAG TPA: acyl carrier protein [Clostridiales bacterium]|nr:acyl carrier protein [Clostridiales bacterium]
MEKNDIKNGLKEFLVSDLGVDGDSLNFDTALFGAGPVGLDSIDSLEIISYVDGEYHVNMTGVGKEHFFSIDTIAEYIASHLA